MLTQAGVVRRIVAVDEFARFELAEDLSSHHHHLLCTNCGLVADFELPPKLEVELETAFAPAAGQPRLRPGAAPGGPGRAVHRLQPEPPRADAAVGRRRAGQWVSTAKKSRDSAVGAR